MSLAEEKRPGDFPGLRFSRQSQHTIMLRAGSLTRTLLDLIDMSKFDPVLIEGDDYYRGDDVVEANLSSPSNSTGQSVTDTKVILNINFDSPSHRIVGADRGGNPSRTRNRRGRTGKIAVWEACYRG